MSEHKESLSAQPETTEQAETQPETTKQPETQPETTAEESVEQAQPQESDEPSQAQTNKFGRIAVVVICVLMIVATCLVMPFLFHRYKRNNAATAGETQTQRIVTAIAETDSTVSLPSESTTDA